MTAQDTAQDAPRTIPADENAIALAVGPSSTVDTEGAVDCILLVRVGETELEVEVTLCPDPGQPTVAGEHQLDTFGSLDDWCSGNLVSAIMAAKDADEDFDATDLIREIVWEVRNAA